MTRFWKSFLLCSPLILIGAVVAVYFQAQIITGRAREYISLAKVVASAPGTGFPASTVEDFYGTIIETLESAEMRRRALDRVRVLHPELKERDVRVTVRQLKGSSIFNITARGDEPKYTRTHLNALLDEFMAFRASMSPPPGSPTVAIMERASGAVEDIQDWTSPLAFAIIMGGGLGALVAFLIASRLGRSEDEPGRSGGKSFGP